MTNLFRRNVWTLAVENKIEFSISIVEEKLFLSRGEREREKRSRRVKRREMKREIAKRRERVRLNGKPRGRQARGVE